MSNVNAPLAEKYKLVADTIRSYPMQLTDAWEDIGKMAIPDDYKSVDNIILCGMGGSALGGRMVLSVASNRLRVPFEVSNQYKLPNYVNEKTLVIVSSYSGTTEETIACTYEAINKGAKVFGITTGGKLKEILTENNLPCYVIDERYNPSKQPRMSIGYATGSILALLTKLGLVHILNEEIEEAVNVMHKVATEFHEHVSESTNLAKKLYREVKDLAIAFVASEHLIGSTHTIKNQFNENAKTFSTIFELPELNHHLLEGLGHPAKLKTSMVFFFIESGLYPERVQKRYKITKDIVKKYGYHYFNFTARSKDRLSQAFEVVMMGSFLTYFITADFKIDPLEIPWVDYFKSELAKNN